MLGWDVWNEPDNINRGSYEDLEPKNKVALILALLPKVFEWAREAHPTQPLTSGVWKDGWSSPDKLDAMEKIQIEMSDVISFHSYDKPEDFEKRILWLQPCLWVRNNSIQQTRDMSLVACLVPQTCRNNGGD